MADITGMLQATAGNVPAGPSGFSLYVWGGNIIGEAGVANGNFIAHPREPIGFQQQDPAGEWAQLSISRNFGVGIKPNGTLWAWGLNSSGQLGLNNVVDSLTPTQVGALSNWAQVSAGGSHCHAVKTDGTLWSWGAGSLGRLATGNVANVSSPVQIGALTTWDQTFAGSANGLAITTAGALWAWGAGGSGQLGQTNILSRSSPIQVNSGAVSAVTKARFGGSFLIFLQANGAVTGTGLNTSGQLGINSIINRSAPVQIQASGATDIAGGDAYTLIVNAGRLFATGAGASGVLGTDTSINRSVPTQVGSLTDWSKIAAAGQTGIGSPFCSAIKTDGTLWGWGAVPGDSTIQVSRSSPVQIGSATWSNFEIFCEESLYIFAIKNSQPYFWGKGGLPNNNNVGLATAMPRSISPLVQIGEDNDWKQLAFAPSAQTITETEHFTFGIKSNGTLWSWGSNFSHGKLAQNAFNDIVEISPIQVGSATDWQQVALTSNSGVAVKTNGTLWAWGFAELCGQNNVISRSVPTQIGNLSTWSQVAAGSTGIVMAIQTNNTLWSWGFGSSGALGLGTVINRSSPVQVGSASYSQVSIGNNFVLAVRTDGTLWSWGLNNFGQLGQNNLTQRSAPFQVGSLSNWAQVSAGERQSYAVKTDGTLWAWGDNANSTLGTGIGNPFSSPVQVGALTDWSRVVAAGGIGNGFNRGGYAIKTDGTLWSWGHNRPGLETPINSPVQVGTETTWVGVPLGNSTVRGGVLKS
jgi:alpha-tubulin suppressor-like RCC1 family protein